MMEKKRICFIAQFPPPIHGLSKAVETLYDSALAEEFYFEKVDITRNRAFIKNLCAIAESRADLFYFTISQTRGGNLRDLVILKLLQIQHKRCIVHLHGGYYRTMVERELPRWQKKANYAAMGRLEGTIVLGDSLRCIFRGMLPEEKIFVVPNGVDDQYYMEDVRFEKKMAEWDKQTVKHVLYLSNFIREKGYYEVLELAKREQERCAQGKAQRLHFDFAGAFFDPEEKTAFFRYIEEQGLQELVSYHGVVEGKEKKALLANCQVFMLLTRYPKEGQPISILEAMGNGLLVVTTNHAGIPDVVVNDQNGIVMDKDAIDIDQCDRLLREKLHATEELRTMLRNNRALVRARYSQAAYVAHIGEILRKVSL